MKLGVSTLCLFKHPFEEVLKGIGKLDEVDVWEIVDEGLHKLDEKRVKQLTGLGKEYTVHARFADINTATLRSDLREVFLKMLCKSLELSYKLNSKIWVLHAGVRSSLGYLFPEEEWRNNVGFLKSLSKKAEELDMIIAVENLIAEGLIKKISDLRKLIEEVNSEYVKACIDVGHLNVLSKQDIVKQLKEVEDYIVSMHLHDNRGDFDAHLEIGSGNIKWSEIFKFLKETRYENYAIIETYGFREASRSFKIVKKLLRI